MRVMLVGTGAIAYRHAAACRDLDGADLVAVCDVRREAADALAEQFGVESRYTELDVMLASEQADLAIIAAWGVHHAEIVEKLARSGKVRAILCEKPLAMDAAQAEAMAKVTAEHNVRLAEAFRLRHQPIHHRAIEIIRSGQIGEVRHVRNAIMSVVLPEDRDPLKNWRFNQAVGGGVTYDIGCYCINQIRWALDAEPETVQAFGTRGPTGVDEHVVAIATFPGGRTAEWCVSWQAGPRHVAEVMGSAGSLRIENAWGDNLGTATTLEIFDLQRNRTVETFEPTDQFFLQLQHMQDCLDNGVPHRIPPEDSIAQMRVIDAVYASLASGQPTTVSSLKSDSSIAEPEAMPEAEGTESAESGQEPAQATVDAGLSDDVEATPAAVTAEDEAVAQLAATLVGDGVYVDGARNGQVPLISRRRGWLRVIQAGVERLNRADGALLFTSLGDRAAEEGEVIGGVMSLPRQTSSAASDTVESSDVASDPPVAADPTVEADPAVETDPAEDADPSHAEHDPASAADAHSGEPVPSEQADVAQAESAATATADSDPAEPAAIEVVDADQAEDHGPIVNVEPFPERTVALVALGGLSEPLLDQTRAALGAAVEWFGSRLDPVVSVLAGDGGPADAFRTAGDSGASVILVAAADATDPLDAVLDGLRLAGGTVGQVGLPLKPGTSCWTGRIGEAQILGLAVSELAEGPGAVDLLLPRLLLGEALEPDLIARLAVGGLVPSLPTHRVLSEEPARP